MKRIKKLVSIMLAMVMVLAMTMTAFASNSETPDEPTTDIARTFKLYQIFTGVPEEAADGSVTGTLSDVKWGFSAKIPTPQGEETEESVLKAALDALTATTPDTPDVTANDRNQLKVIESYTDFSKPFMTEQPAEDEKGYKYSELAPGYYLIEDTTEQDSITGNNTTRSLYVVRVTNGDLVFAPKVSGVPTPDKSVQDTNDSEKAVENPTWDKSADYDIGDEIPYQIAATLPDATSMARYTEYKLTFRDEFSDGLDFIEIKDIKIVRGTNDPVSIKNELNKGTEADYSEVYTESTRELVVTFNDVKKAPISVTGGEKIIIEYTARLNDRAATGAVGNPNTLVLEYPNEPSYNGDGTPGTGTTPPVTAIVFTFRATVNKVDDTADHNPLPGAEFTLYKWMEVEKTAEDGTVTNEFDWVKLTTTPNVTDGTTFDFKGLDDGRYKLVESKTPNGYNTMADIIFEVVVTHDATLGDSNALTKIEIVDEDGDVISGDGKKFEIVNLPGNLNDGIETDIVNYKGSLLPSTGGIGTTIFYVVGAILVIGAGVLLVTKRRMRVQ